MGSTIRTISVGHASITYFDDELLGNRIGDRFSGVDACWCSPAEFMGVKTFEMHITYTI